MARKYIFWFFGSVASQKSQFYQSRSSENIFKNLKVFGTNANIFGFFMEKGCKKVDKKFHRVFKNTNLEVIRVSQVFYLRIFSLQESTEISNSFWSNKQTIIPKRNMIFKTSQKRKKESITKTQVKNVTERDKQRLRHILTYTHRYPNICLLSEFSQLWG